jgi:hypothetical protein
MNISLDRLAEAVLNLEGSIRQDEHVRNRPNVSDEEFKEARDRAKEARLKLCNAIGATLLDVLRQVQPVKQASK